jgi:hypothetical protein
MLRLLSATFGFLAVSAGSLAAQFAPTLLANRSYWTDGKSEIDFYQAEFPRDGEPHPCEVVLILTPLFVDQNSLASIDAAKSQDGVPAIRMLQSATIPRGLAADLRSIDALWRMDSMSLARLSFAGSDPLGVFAKTLREVREQGRTKWTYSGAGYLGATDLKPVELGKPTVAYDELPLRLRTIDFSKPNGGFDVDLAPTMATAQNEFGDIKPAKITWNVGGRTIDVEVQHQTGKDTFTLDSNFPFLLREWRAGDGTHWRMKNSIRARYVDYLKNGDRERALKDPMLRHPD